MAPSGHPIVGHGLGDCIRRVCRRRTGTNCACERSRKASGAAGSGSAAKCTGSSAYPGIKEQGNAIVKMNEDGTVTLITGTAGLGTGAHTALSQIVAEELGVPFEAVSVVQGDTDIVPWDIGAFASHTTYLGGRAAQLAAADVRRQVLEHAAPLLKAAPEDLAIRDGFVVVTNGSNRSIRLCEAVGPQRECRRCNWSA